MAKIQFVLADWLDKSANDIFTAFVAGNITADEAKIVNSERDKRTADRERELSSKQPTNIAAPGIRKDGLLRGSPGCKDTGYQLVNKWSNQSVLVNLMLIELAKGTNEVEIECRDFGAKKDAPKIKRTLFRIGSFVAGNDAAQRDSVVKFLKSLPTSAT